MLQTELLQETYKTTKNKIAIQIENSKSKRVSLVLVQRTFSLLLFATITIHFIYNFSSFFFGHRRLVLSASNFFNSFFSARRYYIRSGFEPNKEQKNEHELSASEMLRMHTARSA